MEEKVLLIGNGGREHALAWSLSKSPTVRHIYVAPGNAGTANAVKCSNLALDIHDMDAVIAWCRGNDVTTVVVGPEGPLANGISDALQTAGLSCFGPSAKAARIESCKAFAKDFMTRWKVPTARYGTFNNYQEAEDFIKSCGYRGVVVKASGLAAGKGVMVTRTQQEACAAARDILQEKRFGSAGDSIVIEELLEGEEISCLAFSDGEVVAALPPAQDHKRLSEGDLGPNTGGMGAYCPCSLVSEAELKVIERDVLLRTIEGLRQEGMPYKGVLYAGLMLTKDGPKVLEFNCRFGDPETQVLLPLLKSDLHEVILACMRGTLSSLKLQFHCDRTAVAVVTASEGYPGTYRKGLRITGLDAVADTPRRLVFHAGTATDGRHVITSGGRVLAVVAIETDARVAVAGAQAAAAAVHYEGNFFRRDIAKSALLGAGKAQHSSRLTYADSGVDISAGDGLVAAIKPLAAATARPGCLDQLGMFGALFDVQAAGYRNPILVSGTDGVGTKLKVAQTVKQHGSVGEDLVAMCVNDVICHGAEPLFFLDYFACGKLEVGVASAVIDGIARGCKRAGCALIGGETAEMPGMYAGGEYDLAGFCVGAVEGARLLPRLTDITPGDTLVGLAASGVHSNGFSLVRRVVETVGLRYEDRCPYSPERTLGDALLTPTAIYARAVLDVLRSHSEVKAIAHVTGGGLPGNVSRVVPGGVSVRLDAVTWDIPPVFGWLASRGGINATEMARTFNCGLGLVLVVDISCDVTALCTQLESSGQRAWAVGHVVPRQPGMEAVEVDNLPEALQRAFSPGPETEGPRAVAPPGGPAKKRKVGVLISGSGTNLQALIDHTSDLKNPSSAQIVLVISNKAGVQGLQRAKTAGIPTQVINHKDYDSREAFDMALHERLLAAGVEIVCLAGFMRILTGTFVRLWAGAMLNVHPSLLPSFKGAHAHRAVLEAGVTLTGCTVHFVAEEVDGGAILVQESVPVHPGDTEATLSDRVKVREHVAFPRALELVASGKATLGGDGKIVWRL